MSDSTHLIVRQYPEAPPRFDVFLRELSEGFDLDIFLSRQRLIGRGIAVLTNGASETLAKLSGFLQQHGVVHWLLIPQPVTLLPQRIFALQVDEQKIAFDCKNQQVAFPATGRVLAILADASGHFAERLLGRVLSSNAYLGRDGTHDLTEDDLIAMILQQMPVLDLYRLDAPGNITAAVRIFPGRYNPAGLGDAATLSSRRNLLRLLELVRDQAAQFRLHTGFGLDSLPGCQVHRADKTDTETLKRNLQNLTNYGWLMADLWRGGPVSVDCEVQGTGSGEVSLPSFAPLLAATPLATDMSGLPEEHPLNPLFNEMTEAVADESPSQPAKVTAQRDLPPPPAAQPAGWTKARIRLFAVFVGIVLSVFILLVTDQQALLERTLYHLFGSGTGVFAVALLFLWLGFYKLRIKRKMENTPTSRIRSVAMGMVEVKGRARRSYALVSPMSQLPCVFYRLTHYRRDKNNRWRVTSVTTSDHVPFLLEDETGRVEIDPSQARVRAGTRQEGVPGQIGLLRVESDDTEKWVEETIIEGTLLYVLGFAAVKKDRQPTLQERVRQALRELKQNPDRLKEFDADGDGRISADEWDTVRVATEETVLQQSIATHVRKRQEEHIIIGKRKGQSLIIAETHSETQLTGRYRNEAVFFLVLSAAATGLAIHLLLNYIA